MGIKLFTKLNRLLSKPRDHSKVAEPNKRIDEGKSPFLSRSSVKTVTRLAVNEKPARSKLDRSQSVAAGPVVVRQKSAQRSASAPAPRVTRRSKPVSPSTSPILSASQSSAPIVTPKFASAIQVQVDCEVREALYELEQARALYQAALRSQLKKGLTADERSGYAWIANLAKLKLAAARLDGLDDRSLQALHAVDPGEQSDASSAMALAWYFATMMDDTSSLNPGLKQVPGIQQIDQNVIDYMEAHFAWILEIPPMSAES